MNKDELLKQYPHSYVITYLPTNEKYIGIVLKKGKTYKDRLNEHINGKNGASVSIQKLILNGASSCDFSTKFLFMYNSINEAIKEEQRLIDLYDSYRNGLNCNRGGGLDTSGYYKVNQWCEKAYYNFERNTTIQSFIENIAKNQSIMSSNKKILYTTYRYMYHKSIDITYSDGWKMGRIKFKDRMNSKMFTDKEKLCYEGRKESVKENWDTLPEEKRNYKLRGLLSMNEKMKCPYCEYSSTKSHVYKHIKKVHNEDKKDN